jgi:hypothetical protein
MGGRAAKHNRFSIWVFDGSKILNDLLSDYFLTLRKDYGLVDVA